MWDDSYFTVETGDIRTVGNRIIKTNKKKKVNAASHTGIHKTVVLMTYIYLALPMVIFLLGWCRPLVGIPLAGVCVWSLVLCFRNRENYIELEWKLSQTDKWKLVVIAAIIFVWVALSGVGGYAWQNEDHASRNRMFNILVDYKWPPTAGEKGFVYYVGTWLPAALVGKISDLDKAYAALFLWILLGVFLVYALICIWRRKIVLWPLLILIFFSGLDIIGYNILTEDAIRIWGSNHLEWWASRQPYVLQYTCNTAQLYWVFNQAIPVWLVMMLLFMDESPKNMIWTSALITITSTLPFIGMVPILVYYMFQRSEWCKPESVALGWKMVLHNMASFQNLAGGGSVLIISFLYLMGNTNSTIISTVGTDKNAVSPLHLSIWFPWLFLLAVVAAVLLLGTLVIWVSGKGKGPILRSMLYAMVAFVLVIQFFKTLGTEQIGGNAVYRLAFTILFVLLETGIYLYLLLKDVEDKRLFSVVAITLMVIPFIRIGTAGDFCMRASIPGLFIVMLWCIEALGKKRMNLRIIVLLVCLVIGSVTPVHEIKRTLIKSHNGYEIEVIEDERIMNASNFAGSLDTFFWQYIARKK